MKKTEQQQQQQNLAKYFFGESCLY